MTSRIGTSLEENDGYFAQMPHLEGKAQIVPISGGRGDGRATPYNIDFAMPKASKGKATLRLAINATTGTAPGLNLSVTGTLLPVIALAPSDGALLRHQMYGRWYEIVVPFDAALLKAGDNRLTLTMPVGPLNNGVVYDYLRLELDELAKPKAN